MFDIANIEKPDSLEGALEMLARNPDMKVIAGGTDILIHMHKGALSGVELLSLRNISGMDGISILEDGTISIGAMTTFAGLCRNDIVNKYVPVLSESAATVGSPQIRNMATIGGNICNGAVSADSAATLFAYNAALKLTSSMGTRVVEIGDFYMGPGKVSLLPGEVLTNVLIPRSGYQDTCGCYIKYSTRKAMDIAMLGVSAICRIEEGKFSDVRIALGVAAPTPMRCSEAEAYAKGKDIDKSILKETSRYAVKASKARDSWRASKAYREHLIETLTYRALKEAVFKGGGALVE